jgi:signal transduction histidine kinase
MVRSLRTTTLFVVVVNTAFAALDYASHPESFGMLLAVRMAWNAAMAAVFALASRFDPLRMLQAGVMASGAALLALIAAAGGLSSDYWPGIMILFVGIPVFLPVSGAQAAGMSAVLLTGFALIPVFTGESLALREYLAPVFFASAAAVECVASSALLDRLRIAEFIQKREIEEARDHLSEMDKVKARFTANVHHELRTPLTLTLAPLESLLAGDFGELSPTQSSYLRTMHTNALRLLKLINNLLDLAKIESGQIEIHREPLDVSRLVQDLAEGAKPLAQKKGIDLDLRLEGGVHVNADRDAIEKVVMNLLGNALKFSEPGDRVALTLEQEGEAVHCAVHDSGPGLEREQLKRIFDRFAQVDTSATRKHEGTGIGLSLSKELVELHGGEIWAESEGLGKGATVHFWLPRGEADDLTDAPLLEDARAGSFESFSAEIAATKRDEELRFVELERNLGRALPPREDMAPGSSDSKATVLVCEDNHDMRRLLKDLLISEFNVRLASNGREGLESVRRAPPDLVLTDVMMPEMSGIELCRSLKTDDSTAAIPVVLVTSKAEREMKIEGLERGADDYVTKPFHSRELLARVRSLVKLRRMGAALEVQNHALADANSELARTLTDLKEAEARVVRSERLAAVGELAAGIAHEVNNPVNFAQNAAMAIRSYAEELRTALQNAGEDSSGLRQEEKLVEVIDGIEELSEIVNEGLERTGRLVGDLRDFAAPGQGDRTAVDISQVVHSALQLMRYFAQKSSVEIELQEASRLPLVWGDRRAIGQVVLNILKNAVEALESTGGTIRVNVADEKSGVSVAIHDNGPGVLPDDQERLFEPFFTTKEAGKGTGLGLSISRQVIEEHGGTLSVTSQCGQGATFTVWLPTESVDAS